jgi:hypothetical protein
MLHGRGRGGAQAGRQADQHDKERCPELQQTTVATLVTSTRLWITPREC